MSLNHAILGFLSYAPLTGYDLKKIFDASVRHFWPADQAQIYRSLARLSEEGWAEVEVAPQPDRPDRKVYHLTEAGRRELLRWLAAPLPMEVREAALVQVFFAARLEDGEVLKMLKTKAGELRTALENLRLVPGKAAEYTPHGSERDIFFWLLTLENGLAMTEASLKWLESVIARIRQKDYRVNLDH